MQAAVANFFSGDAYGYGLRPLAPHLMDISSERGSRAGCKAHFCRQMRASQFCRAPINELPSPPPPSPSVRHAPITGRWARPTAQSRFPPPRARAATFGASAAREGAAGHASMPIKSLLRSPLPPQVRSEPRPWHDAHPVRSMRAAASCTRRPLLTYLSSHTCSWRQLL